MSEMKFVESLKAGDGAVLCRQQEKLANVK